MSLAEFLGTVTHVLEGAGVPYMLTGSLASAFYAVPRATHDLDVVIATDEAGVDRVVQGLLDQGWYADRDAAREALSTRGQFTAIAPPAAGRRSGSGADGGVVGPRLPGALDR